MTNAEATITENAATIAEQGAHVAPEKASPKKGASQKKGAPKSQKRAKAKGKAAPKKEAQAGKKAKPAEAKEASTPRAESKSAKILELIGRPKGATPRSGKPRIGRNIRSGAFSRLPPRSTASRSSPRRPRRAIGFTKSKNRISASPPPLVEGGGFFMVTQIAF